MSNELSDNIDLPSLEQEEAWEDIIPLDEYSIPEISADTLPSPFKEFARALAKATETPESLVGMTILGMISTAVASRFVVSPKSGWYEPVNIYTLMGLPPANNKSLVIRTCTQPLNEWEACYREGQQANLKRQNSERKTQEKIIDSLRLKAAKMDECPEQQLLIKEIAEKEATLLEIDPTLLIYLNDATPEALAAKIAEQKGRLAIISDEGGIFETLSGLYSQGHANIDVLLKGIDGGMVRIYRKDKCLVLNPYLTIVLALQPGVIQALGQKKAFDGNGLLGRFLYLLPQSLLGFRTHNTEPVPEAVQKAYEEKIYGLLNQFLETPSPDKPYILTLSSQALAIWQAFQREIEKALRPDGRLANCSDWGGKVCGYALRIAGLLHVAEFAATQLTIAEPTMQAALTITRCLIEHALAAFNLMGADIATLDAKEIAKWLKRLSKNSFTQSELLIAMRNRKLGRLDRLEQALLVLRKHHILSEPIKKATRKPTTIYYCHPSLIAKEIKT